MRDYPINLKLTGKRCAVIGGGEVALRKIRGLLECGGQVLVISPNINKVLQILAEAGKITWLAKEYQRGDLTNFFLVICAADSKETNLLAAEEAKEAGALVDAADNQEVSDFSSPAQVRRGALLITVSTSGRSPAFARLIKEEIASAYGEEYGQYLELIAAERLKIRNENEFSSSQERGNFWRETLTLNKEILRLLRAGKFAEAQTRIRGR